MFTVLPHYYFGIVQLKIISFGCYSISFCLKINIDRSVFGTQSRLITETVNNETFVFFLSELKQYIFSGTKHILQTNLNIVMTTEENCFQLRICTSTKDSHKTE